MEKKLSIIIPMYNSENSIGNTIESALPFCKDTAELILVDDGSTDQTTEVCRNYVGENIRMVTNRHAKGVSGARNTGIEEARGKFIAFLDSDDELADGFSTVLNNVELQSEHPEVIIFGYLIESEDGIVKQTRHPGKTKRMDISSFMSTFLIDLTNKWMINPCWNKLFKRDFLRTIAVEFREGASMGEDFNFVLKCLSNADTIQIVDTLGYKYIEHEGDRLTGKYHPDKLEIQTENYAMYKAFQRQYSGISIQTIKERFYDDIQSFLDDSYYLSGCSLRKARTILHGVLNNPIQMEVICDMTDSVNDWKLAYLQDNAEADLHRKMAVRKWKGIVSRWIHKIK